MMQNESLRDPADSYVCTIYFDPVFDPVIKEMINRPFPHFRPLR